MTACKNLPLLSRYQTTYIIYRSFQQRISGILIFLCFDIDNQINRFFCAGDNSSEANIIINFSFISRIELLTLSLFLKSCNVTNHEVQIHKAQGTGLLLFQYRRKSLLSNVHTETGPDVPHRRERCAASRDQLQCHSR